MPAVPADRAERIRREGAKLIALIAATTLLFFGTRLAAERSHALALRDAAEWHVRGQRALSQGELDTAIDAFRRATLRDRTNTTYALALAAALIRDNQVSAAERLLVGLQQSAPDVPDVNVQLSRLAARNGDLTRAVRDYRNAMNAPRSPLSESAPAHAELGDLLARAGEAREARDEYERALRLMPAMPAALIGAGRAAFVLGDYDAAQRYLASAPALDGDAMDLLAVSNLVLTRDPLAARLGPAVRRRRIEAALADARASLERCAPDAAATFAWPDLPDRVDPDDMEAALTVVGQAEQVVTTRCAPGSATDRALRIIARRRAGAE